MRDCAAVGAMALLLLAGGTASADYETLGGHPACGQPHWLEAAILYAEEGDARYERYIDTGRCIETREGMSVSVIGQYGDGDADRLEIEFRGIRFYTLAEAVGSAL